MPTSYRCAEASAPAHEPMLATGSQVRGWLLIEVRGAWGEDAIHDSALGEHVPPDWKDQLKRRHVRAVCIRSHLASRRHRRSAVRLRRSAARRPGRRRCGAVRCDRWPTCSPPSERSAATSPGPRLGAVDEQRSILVCTNGRHDQCCANRGRPVVRALRESPWADRVWECSHIGGDRFAANVVVLPDSLYFGRVEPDAGAGAAGRARRRSDRPRPLPRTHVVLARRAGGRALRARASSASTRSTP